MTSGHHELDEVTSLLLNGLRRDPAGHDRLTRASGTAWESIMRLARSQGVEPLLSNRLLSLGTSASIPASVRAALADARRRCAARNLILLHDAGRAVAAMQVRGIAAIVLKGIYLASDVYANAACRRIVDIDLLVRPGHLAAASETLRSEGYAPASPIDTREDTAASYDFHLPRFMKAGHAGIEVHWRLGPTHRQSDVAGLWERAGPVRVGGAAALALCPEDTLLHLCGHASHQHQFAMGLRPLCDIAATIDRFAGRLDWSSLAARARQWRWNRGVYLSLRLARDLVDAAVPDDVLLTLGPPAFDDTLMASARAITLRSGRAYGAVPLPMAAFARATSIRDKVRMCMRSVFMARSELADAYALPRDSPRVPLYYAVRLKDLLTRRGRAALRLLRGDSALLSIADEKIAIDRWLTEYDDASMKGLHEPAPAPVRRSV